MSRRHPKGNPMMRRSSSLLFLAWLMTSCNSGAARPAAAPQDTASYGRPTIVARGQGEQLMMRGSRPLFIVADSATVGSRTLVAGYEDVPPNDSVRVHMHLGEDEIIFLHRGEIDVLLGTSTHRASAGATIFIPRGTWIGFRTVGTDTAGFFFVFNAPAFEKCLRALSARPGERFVALGREALQHVGHECHWVPKAP
jgi:mannose-6-phosphate isomerase-like protein (cupin superfamily)